MQRRHVEKLYVAGKQFCPIQRGEVVPVFAESTQPWRKLYCFNPRIAAVSFHSQALQHTISFFFAQMVIFFHAFSWRRKKKAHPENVPNSASATTQQIHTRSKCAKPFGLDTPILKIDLFTSSFESQFRVGRLQSVCQIFYIIIFLFFSLKYFTEVQHALFHA